MARPLFVLLLVGIIVQLCSGAIYVLSVDPVGGQDVPLCVTEPGGDGTSVTTNTSCRTIKYALSPLTSADFLELTLLSGVYSGPDNINQELNVIDATVQGRERAIIDCENRGRALTIRDATGNIPHTITGIEFRNCVGTSGGAITIAQRLQRLTLNNCTFNNNHATQSGGAIYGSTTAASNLVITNCVFKNNSAVGNGGAIASEGQILRVEGSVFERNSAVAGGAIYGNNIGSKDGFSRFINNRFTNNSVSTGNGGGAFFATSSEERSYSFLGSIIDNNCASSGVYTNSYDVQVRCASDVNCTILDRGNATGCLSTYVPPDASSEEDKKISNRDRAIIIGVVVPFAVIAVIAIALFLYIRKKHVKEMGKRDDYRKKILRALENMPPEEQEAARRDAENADPSRPKCQLCQTRAINSPLPCGHEIVCSVCRTILLECPVKGCKKSTR